MYYGNTKITEIKNDLLPEEKRRNLKNLYDVINNIAKKLYNSGTDVKKYFYTDCQYENIKKNKENLI